MKPWMFDITAPDGTKLHGAGAQRSEAWWKVGGGWARVGMVGLGAQG